jgi:hypothetical protein
MANPGWEDIIEEDAWLHKEDMDWDYSTDPEEQGCSELPPRLNTATDYLRMRLREKGFASQIFPVWRVANEQGS